jgi:hypothetical protein
MREASLSLGGDSESQGLPSPHSTQAGGAASLSLGLGSSAADSCP